MRLKLRLTMALLFAVLVSSVWAIDVPTPAGYTPWFSIEGSWTTSPVILRPSAETLPDNVAIMAIVAAANLVNYSPVSDPSDEVLVVPAGTPIPVRGWPGTVFPKKAGSAFGVSFVPGTGLVTKYTVFYKERDPFGACGKPGKPAILAPQ